MARKYDKEIARQIGITRAEAARMLGVGIQVIRTMEKDGRLHPVKLWYRGHDSNFFDPREVELFRAEYAKIKLESVRDNDAMVVSWFERTGGDSSPSTLARILNACPGVGVERVKRLYQEWMYGVETPTDIKAESSFNAAIERLTAKRRKLGSNGQ